VTTAATSEQISLAEQAYLTIRDRLVLLDIRPGAPINDDLLGRELGLGRTPVREALKRLERERLVVAYPRRGTFATDVNITDLGQISQVRQALEPVAAASAAKQASAVERAALGLLVKELSGQGARAGASGVGSDLMRLDLRVHRAIYSATHNPYLEDTLVHYDNLATRVWCLFLNRLPDLAGHIDEHAGLLRAIIQADEPQAAKLAEHHVARFEQAIRAAM
jgi:DNA-binding GntR family transcriptional regulator